MNRTDDMDYFTQAIYCSSEFPEYTGKQCYVANDNSDEDNPCYRIKFIHDDWEVGNIGDDDLTFVNDKYLTDNGRYIFKVFMRKNYNDCGVSDAELNQLGRSFYQYLYQNLNRVQQGIVIPKTGLEIVRRSNSPKYLNGFHPTYHRLFHKFLNQLYKG